MPVIAVIAHAISRIFPPPSHPIFLLDASGTKPSALQVVTKTSQEMKRWRSTSPCVPSATISGYLRSTTALTANAPLTGEAPAIGVRPTDEWMSQLSTLRRQTALDPEYPLGSHELSHGTPSQALSGKSHFGTAV
ncbi:hypothetical protein LshimejAT787_2600520 [Lyophyllum shimeji]|uniref:Uncharacterized protein n=1 Tax=Lyophyllum shimeji TaxID=47721 RepID=A0A9P3Q272_LYOSH|nr:hypothetical protein LshimejAT787_2600520 [Lyophyllum shimeji]